MPTAPNPPVLSAARTAAAIAQGRMTAREAVEAAQARIAARNPELTALIHEDPVGALTAADAADARQAAGRPLGPLHGVPVVMKDLYDDKPGWPTTMGGLPQLRGTLATTACPFVERIEAAGAIILGKTNSPVFGFRGTTDNPAFGATANPFDPTCNAGGSSGGSAAAVAAGLVPLAEATDGGGSIRIPAAWCNLVGLKPSAGRVPLPMRPNVYANTLPYVSEGTLSRDVADARLALEVLSGPHRDDPNSHPLAPRTGPSTPLAGLRIAYCPTSGGWPVEPAVAEVVDAAVAALEAAGAVVEQVPLNLPAPHDALTDLWCRLMTPAMRLTLAGLKNSGLDLLAAPHRDSLPPRLLEWLEVFGPGYRADALYQDLSLRTGVHDAFQALLDRFDIIAAPTVCALPVPNGPRGTTVGPDRINGVTVDPLIGWCPTILANFTGLPAISVPAGLSSGVRGGLPVGLELTGRRHADLALLDIAAAIEQIRPWALHFEAMDSAVRAVG